jgi:hypothetical protein
MEVIRTGDWECGVTDQQCRFSFQDQPSFYPNILIRPLGRRLSGQAPRVKWPGYIKSSYLIASRSLKANLEWERHGSSRGVSVGYEKGSRAIQATATLMSPSPCS